MIFYALSDFFFVYLLYFLALRNRQKMFVEDVNLGGDFEDAEYDKIPGTDIHDSQFNGETTVEDNEQLKVCTLHIYCTYILTYIHTCIHI